MLLDDSRLLGRDLLDRVAEDVDVVQADGCHDRDLRIGDVRRVPAAAEADLHDRDVDGRVGEGRVSHADHDLEERHGDTVVLLFVNHLDVRLDVFPDLHERLAADRFAVDRDPLTNVAEVGR